jgi:uncharacterized membrane protein
MNILFKVFLILHIIGGSTGLIAGMFNILRQKGDKNHKLIGKIFFVSMMIAGTSSLVLAYLNLNFFLFMVGVFTLYMVGSGQRYLKHKQLSKHISKRLDWAITILMLVAAILFVATGISAIIKSNLFGLVILTFGGLGLLFVRQDAINYNNKSTLKNYWLVAHLQRMIGGFIAALTAFLVVNAKYFPDQIPGFVYWLLPTAFLTPMIIKWSKIYEVRKKIN